MTEETTYEGTQKVTTNYERQPKTTYEGTARGDDRREGESRVEQNRRKRDEARSLGSSLTASRPDSRESLKKEKKRKYEAEENIASEADKVRSRQVIEDLRESSAKKKQAQKQTPREPTIFQNIGSGVGHYVDARRGPPVWMGVGSGTPAFLRMSGPTRLPGWVMGGSNISSLPTSRRSSKKRSQTASRGTGLPEWFRY